MFFELVMLTVIGILAKNAPLKLWYQVPKYIGD